MITWIAKRLNTNVCGIVPQLHRLWQPGPTEINAGQGFFSGNSWYLQHSGMYVGTQRDRSVSKDALLCTAVPFLDISGFKGHFFYSNILCRVAMCILFIHFAFRLAPHLHHPQKMKGLSKRLVQRGITACITMPFRKEQKWFTDPLKFRSEIKNYR